MPRFIGNPIDVQGPASEGHNDHDPAIARLSDGRIAFAWAQYENNGGGDYRVFWRVFNADGTPATPETKIDSVDSPDRNQPADWVSITATPDGGFSIGYMDRVHQSGRWNYWTAAVSSNFQTVTHINRTGNTTDGQPWFGDSRGGSLATLADGSVIVVANVIPGDGGPSQLRTYGVNGALLDSGIDFFGPVAITALGDGYLAVYAKGGEIWSVARATGASATPVQLNTVTAGSQTLGAFAGFENLATLSNGSVVAVWTDATTTDDATDPEAGVRARIIGADGVPVGTGEFAINATTSGPETLQSVAALPGGGFVVLYRINPSSTYMIRTFNNAGAPTSPEFLAIDDSGSAAIEVLNGNQVVVSWARSNFHQARIIDLRTFQDGGPGDDPLTGTTGPDVISGLAGNDTIFGLAGNDTLYGNQDNDVLYGNQDDDTLYGGQGNDTEYGGQGNDALYGNLGDDALYGNLGDDILNGGVGTNRLDGADGADTATYADAAAGVTVSLLQQGAAQATGVSTDTLVGIENLTGSGFNDTLTGSTGDNTLRGGAGNDLLFASAGADLVYGGDGDDYVDQIFGGSLPPPGLGGDLADVVYGEAGNDILRGQTGDDRLYGGDGDDNLRGDVGDDVLDGGDGTDFTNYRFDDLGLTSGVTFSVAIFGTSQNFTFADGQGGTDTVISVERAGINGTAFNDVLTLGQAGGQLFGGAGDDLLVAGAGDDLLVGDIGIDTASFTSAAVGVTVSLLIQSPGPDFTGATQNSGAGIERLSSIENLIGSAFGDVLTGDAAANVLSGGNGGDTLSGGLGGDTLNGGAGFDVLYGNQDNDVLDGGADADALYGGQGNDRQYGGLGADAIYGNLGDDTLWHGDNLVPGLAHDDGAVDALYGDVGFDNVFIGLGDFADGGADYDRIYVSFFARDTPLILDLNTDLATATGRLQAASGTTLLNFEELDVYGTNFDDQLTGSGRVDRFFGGNGANILYGLANDDILGGQYGNDQLYGGTGNDTFYYVGGSDTALGEAGNDQFWLGSSFAADPITVGSYVIDGGADADTIDFSRLPVGVTFSLSVVTAQNVAGGTVTASNVENLIGSNGPDVLTGAFGDNVMSGLLGGDIIVGGSGVDVLYGGDGNDQLFGATSGGQSNSPAGVVDGGDILYGEGGDDVLRGREGNDQLFGGAGVDNLRGDAGNDYLDGGDGLDFAGYRFDDIGATAGVTFDGSLFGAQSDFLMNDGRGGTDRVVDIERVGFTGTPFADIVTLGQANGQASGLLGDDLIIGGAGTDVMSGNDFSPGIDGGVDTVSYQTAAAGVMVSLAIQSGASQNTVGAGVDVIYNFDNLIGSAFADILTGDGAANVLTGGGGIDTLSGGLGNDALYGNQDSDVLYGNQDNDLLYGGQGNDVLYGGQGDDLLLGNIGADTLFGNLGLDTFRYSTAGDSTPTASDVIGDFLSGTDLLDLRSIRTGGADTFVIVNGAGVTLVDVDLGGNGSIDMRITLTGTNAIVNGDVQWT